MLDSPRQNNNKILEERDIIIKKTDGTLKSISALHPLQYPLLFPHGDNGWSDLTTTVFHQDFYAYRLQIRNPVQSSLLHLGCGIFEQ